jgi:membrane protein YqaA with SNARE-associated domain
VTAPRAAAAREPGALDAIARFAPTGSAAVLVAAWAAAEAVVLPVVPDVALVLLALAAPRRSVPLFAALVAGALAGSFVLFAFATAAPDRVDTMLRAIPGIDEATIAAADASLTDDGVAGFAQFGPGPPLKVYTARWAASDGGALGLLAGVVLNRLTRIGPVLVAAAVAGWLIPGWLRRHERLVLAGYALAWAAVYALYLA